MHFYDFSSHIVVVHTKNELWNAWFSTHNFLSIDIKWKKFRAIFDGSSSSSNSSNTPTKNVKIEITQFHFGITKLTERIHRLSSTRKSMSMWIFHKYYTQNRVHVCTHSPSRRKHEIEKERVRESKLVVGIVILYMHFIILHIYFMNVNVAHLHCDEMNNWHRH